MKTKYRTIYGICIAVLLVGCASHNQVPVSQPASHASLQDDPDFKLLEEGGRELQRGNALRAIQDYFDPVITHYETRYRDDTRIVYCARSQPEALAYMLKSAGAQQSSIVIPITWSQAYYLKGYANIDLGRIDEARTWINKALEHAPDNSVYHSELGHLYQIEKKWDEASAEFVIAEQSANSLSPESTKKLELLRAKRGRAYSLTELGRLDEAEALYNQCLEIDPDDNKAKHELEYIKYLRSRR